MQVGAFIIHLARAERRRGHVQALLRDCPVPAVIVDAVDGSALTDAEIDAVYRPEGLLSPRYPFTVGRGEIGCFLSHRKAWQAIVDGGMDAGLVFEDDVILDRPVFARAFAAASGWMTVADWIEFQTRPMTGPVRGEVDGCRIVEPVVPPVRLSAQLIGREAAQRMLSVSERFDRPVDGVVQLLGVTRQPILCVEPSGVRDDSAAAGGTTIQGKGGDIFAKLAKSVKRASYRRALRAHVARARALSDQRT